MNMTTGGRYGQELATDLYLITILCIFPLFFGSSGYLDVTFSKYMFWMTSTALWLAALVIFCFLRRSPGRLEAEQLAALAFLTVCLCSWFFSPYRLDGFLGAGRYDGFLTIASYVLCFLGVSRFTRPKPLHAAAFAVGITLCCAVGVLQLFGFDPLRLFPGTMTYYDAGTLYSGAYLGTIGNTNLLDAVLCAALPLFYALWVCGDGGKAGALFLLPLLPGCFLLVRAGGSGAMLALAACALAAAPLLFTDLWRLRRGMRGCALILLSCGAALSYVPVYIQRRLSIRFTASPAVFAALAGALLLFGFSFLQPRRFHPTAKALQRGFFLLDAAAVLGALAAVWFWSGTEGTVYELQNALHGQLSDSFGSSRILIWRECLKLVPKRLLLGGGPGTLALRLDVTFSRFVPETGLTLTSFVDNAHNIYLGYLVNCGALGLASYLGLLACAFRGAMQKLKLRRPMVPALALSVFCAAVHGLFGLGLFICEPFFWCMLGLLCARDKEATV